jgi:hypothetical protein
MPGTVLLIVVALVLNRLADFIFSMPTSAQQAERCRDSQR